MIIVVIPPIVYAPPVVVTFRFQIEREREREREREFTINIVLFIKGIYNMFQQIRASSHRETER